MFSRREFILTLTAAGIAHLTKAQKTYVITLSPQTSPCEEYLNCQWKSAFDDFKDVDDSEDRFPLWDGEPGSDADQLRSCLAALGYYAASRIFPSTIFISRLKDFAYSILLAGQTHNPAAQQAYRDCSHAMGEDNFWLFITRVADQGANFDEVRTSVRWQAQNNYKSIARAWNEWNGRGNPANPVKLITAAYYLYLGQRHNRNAIQHYRAANKENPVRLFSIVEEYKNDPNKP